MRLIESITLGEKLDIETPSLFYNKCLAERINSHSGTMR